MIGTIIIAVIGYGTAVLLGVVGIAGVHLGIQKKMDAGNTLFIAVVFFALAIAAAAITRALAGGW